MGKMLIFSTLFGLLILAWLGLREPADEWARQFGRIGTFSSPQAADLNGDGVLDVVIGAGGEEFEARDTAVIALDGRDGKVLWAAGGKDQLFSSPVFLDINRDQTPDVLMAGRSAQLMAIEGRSGRLLWQFAEENLPGKQGLNFYTPAIVPDQDGDRLADLLLAYGGDVTKSAHEKDRAAGYLMVISSQSGQVLAADSMPDGKETYMSPQYMAQDASVIFGSGGETVGGHLYRIGLAEMITSGIGQAEVLLSDSLKGFIAPPLLHDMNADGKPDLIVSAVNGKVSLLDGQNYRPVWEVSSPGTEIYTTAAAGYFNEDATPDVFINAGVGVWPDMSRCRQLALDGKDGSIIFQDSLSFMSMSSPLTLDIDDDGRHEALLSVNFKLTRQSAGGIAIGPGRIYSKLVAFNFRTGRRMKLAEEFKGANLSVTPWLGDLDDDGQLDLLHAHLTDTSNFTAFNGLSVLRKELSLPAEAAATTSYLP